MQFIFGLGNPGEKYQSTKHNVGFWAVEAIAEKLGLKSQDSSKFFAKIFTSPSILLVQPQTYMNDSGKSVRAVLDYYKQLTNENEEELRNLFVFHDDLDLSIGNTKLQMGTGPKIHNGLLSIYQHLHTKNFWHARIGVDGRNGDRSMPSQSYVLSPFQQAEKEVLNTNITKLVDQVLHQIETENTSA
jgi:PTH1 family peptidyl-tRNA hydrolase